MIRKTRAQALIFQNGHILLVRHFDLYIGEEYWCLPGGVVERGELPEGAAVREVEEETGLVAEIVQFVCRQTFSGVQQGYDTAVTFLARIREGQMRLGSDPEQASWSVKFLREVKWIPLDGRLRCS